MTLTDQKTKIGTWVDGNQIKETGPHVLENDENEIRMGRYQHAFRYLRPQLIGNI